MIDVTTWRVKWEGARVIYSMVNYERLTGEECERREYERLRAKFAPAPPRAVEGGEKQG